MQLDILLFATLRDVAGQKRISVHLDNGEQTIDDVRHALIAEYPQLDKHLQVALAAINEEFAFADDIVQDGDEIAFFPPVSGGNDQPEIFRLPDDPINHDEIIEAITTPHTGAVCVFSGMVRGKTQRSGHQPQTEYLEYEAYAPMAMAKMRQVAREIREKFPLVQGIAIIQRVGTLKIGQNTVLIACSSGHRDEGCFEAARYGIDRLKEIVPVWKKEVGPNGESWVEGDYYPTSEDRSAGKTGN